MQESVHRACHCRLGHVPVGHSTLPQSELRTVKAVAEGIRKLNFAVEVEGHRDPSESNSGLSLARANYVTDLLIQYGVDPTWLTAVDKGSNPPPQGVELNSRVTFHVRYDRAVGWRKCR
jgi:outer membrane protein OmpA-like peptidoglycan-associated protein